MQLDRRRPAGDRGQPVADPARRAVVALTETRGQDQDSFLHSLGQYAGGEFNGNPRAAK